MTYLATKVLVPLFVAACGILWVSSAPPDPTLAPPPAPVVIPASSWTITPQTPAPPPKPTWNGCDSIPLFGYKAGWSEWDIEQLMRIVHRESRCQPTAYNPTDPHGGSYGLTQINGYWCTPSKYWPQGWLQAQGILGRCADLWDPLTNLRAAEAIHRNSGWLPWRTADE